MLKRLQIVRSYFRADRCSRAGDFSGAMAHLSRVIQLEPRNPYAYNDRGVAFQGMRTYASSIEDFNEAIRLRPNLALAYYNRGISWKFLGHNDRAIADETQAVSLNPRLADAHAELGFAHHSQDNLDLSIAHLTQAIKLAPKEPNHLKVRGCIRFYRGAFNAAASDLRRSLDLRHDPYAVLFYYLARAREGEAEAEELATFAKGSETDQWPTAMLALYLGSLSVESALASAASFDEHAEAQFYVGEWHLLRGNREEAVNALRLAAQLCPPWFIEHAGAVAELKRLE
jgi:lipoprotein NlpI